MDHKFHRDSSFHCFKTSDKTFNFLDPCGKHRHICFFLNSRVINETRILNLAKYLKKFFLFILFRKKKVYSKCKKEREILRKILRKLLNDSKLALLRA